ncbi:type II toxin-antitoxin system RelE/ParE family toxin [soil metagenome]
MSSRSYSLVISPSARKDVSDILLFSRKRWGSDQRSNYKARILEIFTALARNPEMGIERSEISQGLRSFPFERHLVLYRIDLEHRLIIERVIHQNRDLERAFNRPD